jgi:hypothetical protein
MLIAAGMTVALVAVWVGVQSLVRRSSGDQQGDADVLACRMCGPDGACHCGLKPLRSRIAGRDPRR